MKYFLLLFVFFASVAVADTPLSADQAFQFSATAKDYQTVLVQFHIAPNYYLYRDHFNFKVIKPSHVELGVPIYPGNIEKLKTTLGTFDVYANQLTIPIPIINATEKNIVLQVHYQGCSEKGYCYPPMNKLVNINLAGHYLQPAKIVKMDIAPISYDDTALKTTRSETTSSLFEHQSLWMTLLLFFGFGVLLSLTPCVLPMIPILSSIIVGKEHRHAFLLSVGYVLGMSITYAIAGVLFGVIGSNIQLLFQQPWIIVCFSLLFVVMALSLFGLFQLQLPESFRGKIATVSHHQKSGTYVGAFLMGVLSTLILSPCVTPPLVAALSYISQTGDAVLGGAALFLLGIGMGLPLLAIGAVGTRLLPKSGAWMNTVKNIMGLFLLAVAIMMLSRVVSGVIAMLLWSALLMGVALYLGALTTAKTKMAMIKKIIGILLFVYGVLLIVGAYQGNTDPMRAFVVLEKTPQKKLVFTSVGSVSQMNSILAASENKIVLLDFSADWCIACKELDMSTFQNKAVQARLGQMILVRADITANSAEDQQLMRHYGVIAPPTILFFQSGREIKNTRIVGFVNAQALLDHLTKTVSSVGSLAVGAKDLVR